MLHTHIYTQSLPPLLISHVIRFELLLKVGLTSCLHPSLSPPFFYRFELLLKVLPIALIPLENNTIDILGKAVSMPNLIIGSLYSFLAIASVFGLCLVQELDNGDAGAPLLISTHQSVHLFFYKFRNIHICKYI